MANKYTFFSPADNLFNYYVTQNDFDESLLFNILFHNRILLPEAYYFGSIIATAMV